MNTKIEKAINLLLKTKPFYAHFFLNAKVCYDQFGVPTAGVGVMRDSVFMVFNTEFTESLTPVELGSVIEHEVLHLLFSHLDMDRKLYDSKVSNIAQDLSINQYIEGLPSGCVSLEGIKKATGMDLEANQTWEYYYGKLIKHKEDLQDRFDSIDDHSTMGGDLGKEADGALGRAGEGSGAGGGSGAGKAAIADAVGKSIKASAGNVPAVILKAYEGLQKEHKVPWQQVLSNFVCRCLSVTNIPTRKKRNRRFGLDQPGKKKHRELTLGVCVDSSGSVSNEDYDQFMAELSRIVKFCKQVYFIEADCVVQNVDTIKKGKAVNAVRRSAGGTAYQPAIDKCMELRCDAIVYFGDFDTSDKPVNPGVPFLWVGVGSSPKPGDFGSEIRI